MSSPARILIVDDDENVLQTFAKALSLEGYDVRTASSPLVGLQEVVETPPDAILLDLRMPFVNGVGFLYRLRAQRRTGTRRWRSSLAIRASTIRP
jgi:Response regulator containing CheY-like receiver, AAA-type ATPase, and DNA-binding domains